MDLHFGIGGKQTMGVDGRKRKVGDGERLVRPWQRDALASLWHLFERWALSFRVYRPKTPECGGDGTEGWRCITATTWRQRIRFTSFELETAFPSSGQETPAMNVSN